MKYLLISLILVIISCSEDEKGPSKLKVGEVSGTVTDPLNSPINKGVVSLLQNSLAVYAAETDSQGKFVFKEQPVGSYELEVYKFGYDLTKVQVTISETPSVKDITIEKSGLPSGGVVNAKVISYSANSVIFEIDVFVLDGDSKPLSVAINNFSLPPASYSNGLLLNFTSQNFSSITPTPSGPYSANLLLDQSGSIATTDPHNSRLQAARAFFGSLGTGDNVVLSAFASGGSIPYNLTVYGNGFITNGPAYYPNLKELATQIGGGTPLYKSVYGMTDYTAANATNANKALIVFTDGMDTDGGYSIDQIIANANAKHVNIYTIGLSASVDILVLGDLAQRGNGAFMWASDADQLISIYKNLGNLLHGTATLYRLRYNATANQAFFPGYFSANLKVISGPSQFTIPFFISVK